jgi:hypothetical protein
MEGGEVQLVDEVVQGRFEGAWYELLLKADGKE